MKKNLYFFFLISISTFAQFQYSGKVNTSYHDATAYLSVISNYKDLETFQTENIIANTPINEKGEFIFSGDFLENTDQLYKIYIDNCKEDITNAKHLLNKCLDYSSISFIANNTDEIHFPLNDLNQMLCEFTINRKENKYIYQLDSLQEELLFPLENAINDQQRKMIYKDYFVALKQFGKRINHPLAELYAYQLYAHKNSFSRDYYLKDVSRNHDYYINLEQRLSNDNLSTYANQFKKDILFDTNNTSSNSNNIIYLLLTGLLLISLFFNYKAYRKKKEDKVSYQDLLTKQEQRIFEEMNNGLSNQAIADKLFISISTVKTHINNIYSKLQITSRKEIEQFF